MQLEYSAARYCKPLALLHKNSLSHQYAETSLPGRQLPVSSQPCPTSRQPVHQTTAKQHRSQALTCAHQGPPSSWPAVHMQKRPGRAVQRVDWATAAAPRCPSLNGINLSQLPAHVTVFVENTSPKQQTKTLTYTKFRSILLHASKMTLVLLLIPQCLWLRLAQPPIIFSKSHKHNTAPKATVPQANNSIHLRIGNHGLPVGWLQWCGPRLRTRHRQACHATRQRNQVGLVLEAQFGECVAKR
jgi:hypothetical protein